MAAVKAKGSFTLDEDDYISLDKLRLPLTSEFTQEDGSFTLCLWMYLLKITKPGIFIRQVCKDSGEAVPFLSMEHGRKLTIHRLSFPSQGSQSQTLDHTSVSADQACPVDKWVHIGCEIGSDITRIHIDGVVVGEKPASHFDGTAEKCKRSIILVGSDGTSDADNVQPYAHYAQVLPQPAVTNHYVKHPPLELSLDGSTGASDDHEVEEGGDGVWSVVGGKASCRRNFALDVVLLDALGRSVHKEMELIALLVYADNGAPVEKPKDDAEAPLLTTFDGVEFPSTDRPIKLVHGRASFKLKISQLSSKCDNRLFRVCFDPPSAPNYPFLRVFSRPIRCVSRNRNSRTPAAAWKRSNPSMYQVDSARSPEEIILEAPQANNDQYVNGDLGSSFMHGPKFIAGQPLVKRSRSGTEKLLPGLASSNSFPEHSTEMGASFLSGDAITSPVAESHNHVFAGGTFGNGCNWPGNMYLHNLQDPSTPHANESDNMNAVDKAKQENIQEENVALTFPDVEVVGFSKSPTYKIGALEGGLPDLCIFKYCLDNMYNRAAFLKGAILCKSDQELSDFAKRVSQYTGCHHNGYQIFIAKKLIQDGNDVWKQVSSQFYPVPWNSMVKRIEEQFLRICASTKRHFSSRDKEFLRQIAGCGEHVSREEFDRLWQWIYPVALSVSNPQVRATWEMEEPKWIEGMIFREEADTLLRTEEGLKAGTFILRFASSRSWPHPDAGALVVSFVGHDLSIHHKLLSLDKSSGFSIGDKRPLSELLLLQNELSQLYRLKN